MLIAKVTVCENGPGSFGEDDDERSWIITLNIRNTENGDSRNFRMIQGSTPTTAMWSINGERGIQSACVAGLKAAGLVLGAEFRMLPNTKGGFQE